ncbi:MAG: Urease accessory protein UreF [Desulfonauticus sp. 38_4375]|nr:MAG: Urease accessory protein UreF [Desulfonauticus sp. 38_4375]
MDTITTDKQWPRESKISTPAMLRLLQICSPSLPIGAYAYSQGMEWTTHAGWLKNEAETCDWILGLMRHSLGGLDVPILARLYRGWKENDIGRVKYWTEFLHASRESAELQAEDNHMGVAMAKVLGELGISQANDWKTEPVVTFATMFALAAVHWEIPIYETCVGYLWSWTENQIAAAIKLVPLGQTAGQRILSQAIKTIPEVVESGLSLQDEHIGFLAPAFAIASALHETQHTRLFRS